MGHSPPSKSGRPASQPGSLAIATGAIVAMAAVAAAVVQCQVQVGATTYRTEARLAWSQTCSVRMVAAIMAAASRDLSSADHGSMILSPLAPRHCHDSLPGQNNIGLMMAQTNSAGVPLDTIGERLLDLPPPLM